MIEVFFWRRALAPSVVHGINFVMNFVSGMSARAQFCDEFHISDLSRDQFCDDFCIRDFGPGSIFVMSFVSLANNFVMNFVSEFRPGLNFVIIFVLAVSLATQFCDEFHIGDLSRDQFCDEFRIRDFGWGSIL